MKGIYMVDDRVFEMISPASDGAVNIPEEKKVQRPWGFYRMFAENTLCTVKILYIKANEMLSLQFHRIRDQVYYIIDPLTVYLTDVPVPVDIRDMDKDDIGLWAEEHLQKYDCKPGTVIKIPRFVIHRPAYEGRKEYGIMLDMAFNQNLESDIVRVKDIYGRV